MQNCMLCPHTLPSPTASQASHQDQSLFLLLIFLSSTVFSPNNLTSHVAQASLPVLLSHHPKCPQILQITRTGKLQETHSQGSKKSSWGPRGALKDLVFCSSWSLELAASLVASSSGMATSSCCSGEDVMVMELLQSNTGYSWFLLFPPQDEKSQLWSSGNEGMGQALPQSLSHHKSPLSLCQGFTASPSKSLFPLLLISNQEIHRSSRPGKLLEKSLQPWLGFGLFFFFYEGLFISLPLCLFSPRLSSCSGSLLQPKSGEKLLEFTLGTKGLLCRRIWRTRLLLLLLLLPRCLFSPCQRAPGLAEQEAGWGGGGHRMGWAGAQTPPTPASSAKVPQGAQSFPNIPARPLCLALPL